MADFNGDGKSDEAVLTDPNSGAITFGWSELWAHEDTLTAITNAFGGSTNVTYDVATGAHAPKGYKPVVVTTSSVSDGRATIYASTRYDYSLGLWDPIERRFLGFGAVKATDQAGGATTETYFRQGEGYPTNRINEVIKYDIAGVMLEDSDLLYKESTSSGVYTSLVGWRQKARCAASSCQYTATEFTYDQYGNITQQVEDGDTAVSGDERTTTTTYDMDSAAYRMNTPSSVTVQVGISNTGAVLARTSFGYNSAGDVTSTSKWLDTSNSTITTSTTYDAYGNAASTTDALGHVTTFTFDPTYHVFQLQTCNPLSQCAKQSWDTTLGVLTSATDIDGQVTTTSYDTLGRRYQQKRPDGSTTTETYVNWGNAATQYQLDSVTDGTADGLTTKTYVDGSAREYKVVREPDVTVLTYYNAQGLKSAVTNPFTTGQSPVYTTYSYDALGRVTAVTHPNNVSMTMSYSLAHNAADADFATNRFVQTICDETGACRRLGYDGYGNEVVTSEWSTTGGTTVEWRTHATYDLLGRLLTTKDAVGNTMTQTWDSLGRKKAMSDPDGGAWSYTYDSSGQVKSADGWAWDGSQHGVRRAGPADEQDLRRHHTRRQPL